MALISYATLTLPTISGGPITNYVAQIKTADMPSQLLDGGSHSIPTGGDEIRVYTASDKVTRIPLEIVRCTTGGSPDVEMYCLLPSADTGSTIYIEVDDSWSQPAAGDAYGSRAVWAGYELVSHDGLVTDSVSGATIVDDGSGSVTTSPWGAALTAPRKRLSDASIANLTSNFCVELWHTGNVTGTLYSRRDDTTHQYQEYIGTPTAHYFFATTGSPSGVLDVGTPGAGWQSIARNYVTATDIDAFANGSSTVANTNGVSITAQAAIPFRIGYRGNGGLGTIGSPSPNTFGEVRVKSNIKTAADIATTFANLDSSTAWYSSTYGPLGSAVKGIEFIWKDETDTVITGLTGIYYAVFDEPLPNNFNAPILKGSDGTTHASTGNFQLDIDSVTAQDIDDDVFVVAYRLDGTDDKLSQVFAGQLPITDIQ